LQPDFEAAYQDWLKKSCFNLCYNNFVYLCYFCRKIPVILSRSLPNYFL